MVFSLHCVFTVCNGIGNLNIGIILILSAHDKIAFQLSNPPYADRVVVSTRVYVDYVFQIRPILNSIIGIQCIIKAQIRKIIFLFTLKRAFGFHIKSRTLINNLGVQQNFDISGNCLLGNLDSIPFQRPINAADAHSSAEIVDDVGSKFFEGILFPNLNSFSNVLFKDFLNDSLYISAFILPAFQKNGSGKSTLQDKRGQFFLRIRR